MAAHFSPFKDLSFDVVLLTLLPFSLLPVPNTCVTQEPLAVVRLTVIHMKSSLQCSCHFPMHFQF